MFEFTNANDKHIKNALRPPRSFYKECMSKFPIYIWENKIDKIVSSDRSQIDEEVIRKRLIKNSRLTFSGKADYFLWIGVSKTRVEFQTYRIQQFFENGQERFSAILYNFEKYTCNEHIKLNSWNGYDYTYGLQMLGLYLGSYSLYWSFQNTDDIFKRLQKNDMFQYLDFNKIKSVCEDGFYNFFDLPIMMPHIYKYRGMIEYAQKINARGIQKDIIGGVRNVSYYGGYSFTHVHEHMGRLTFKFLKKHKQVFKNSDKRFEEYKIIIAMEKELGTKVDPKFVRYFKSIEELKYIPKGVKITRFQNWVIKNSVYGNDYRDYQDMLEKIGVSFEGDFRIMPKNFKQAHDNAVAAYNDLRDELKNQEYHKHLEKLLELEQTIGNYTFILPKELKELKAEGKALKHCVGSYADRVANGETVIVFVRQKRKADNPLYTLEIKGGKIVQLRGKNNKNAKESAWKASETLLLYAKSHKIAV